MTRRTMSLEPGLCEPYRVEEGEDEGILWMGRHKEASGSRKMWKGQSPELTVLTGQQEAEASTQVTLGQDRGDHCLQRSAKSSLTPKEALLPEIRTSETLSA